MQIVEYVQMQYREMKLNGMSDQKIACELGISRMTIHRWKRKGILN